MPYTYGNSSSGNEFNPLFKTVFSLTTSRALAGIICSIGVDSSATAILNTLPILSGLVILPLCGQPLHPPGLALSKEPQECTPSKEAAFSIVASRL